MDNLFSTLKRAGKSLLGDKGEAAKVNLSAPTAPNISDQAAPSQSTNGRAAQSVRERDYSLRARRTSRVAMRLPLKLTTTDGSGTDTTFTAFTSVINKNGAKIHSNRAMVVNDLVKLSVVSTGKHAQAKVIWSDAKLDSNGEFACAVELLKPMNLFDLNFPPEEGEEYKSASPRGASVEMGIAPNQGANNPRIADFEAVEIGTSGTATSASSLQVQIPEQIAAEANEIADEKQEINSSSPSLPSASRKVSRESRIEETIAANPKPEAPTAEGPANATPVFALAVSEDATLLDLAAVDSRVAIESADEHRTMDFTSFLESQSFQDVVSNSPHEPAISDLPTNPAPDFELTVPELALPNREDHAAIPETKASAPPEQSQSPNVFRIEFPSTESIAEDSTKRAEGLTIVNDVAPFSIQIDDVKPLEIAPQEIFSIQLEPEEALAAPPIRNPIESALGMPVHEAHSGKASGSKAKGERETKHLSQEDASTVVHRLKTLREEIAEEFSGLLTQFRQECASQTQQLIGKARAEAEHEFAEQVAELTGRVADRSQQLMTEAASQINERAAKSAEANWLRLQKEATTVISQIKELRNEIVKQMPVLTTQILKECQSQVKREIKEALAAMPLPTKAQSCDLNEQPRALMAETAAQIQQSFGQDLAKQAGDQQRIAIEQLRNHLAQQLPQLAAQFERHCTSRSQQIADTLLESSTQNITAYVNDASGRMSELTQLFVTDASDQMNLRFANLLEENSERIESKVSELARIAQEKLLVWLEEEQQTREKDMRELVILQIQRQFELARDRDHESIRENLADVFQGIAEQLNVS